MLLSQAEMMVATAAARSGSGKGGYQKQQSAAWNSKQVEEGTS